MKETTDPDLSRCELDELKQRMTTILSHLDLLLRDTGPKFRQIGLLREEADIILIELRRRGIIPKDEPVKDGKPVST